MSAVCKDFALVDPGLDTDLTVGGGCFCKAVVDISSQRLQRDGTLVVVLAARDFCAAETTGNGNLDTLCTELHRSADGHLHCTAEGNSFFQLSSDVFSNELCIQVGALDFDNIDGNGSLYDSFAFESELFDFSTAASDNDTGLCAVDEDLDSFSVAFDFDLGNASLVELVLQILSQIIVGNNGVAELLVGNEPSGIPVLDNADT